MTPPRSLSRFSIFFDSTGRTHTVVRYWVWAVRIWVSCTAAHPPSQNPHEVDFSQRNPSVYAPIKDTHTKHHRHGRAPGGRSPCTNWPGPYLLLLSRPFPPYFLRVVLFFFSRNERQIERSSMRGGAEADAFTTCHREIPWAEKVDADSEPLVGDCFVLSRDCVDSDLNGRPGGGVMLVRPFVVALDNFFRSANVSLLIYLTNLLCMFSSIN